MATVKNWNIDRLEGLTLKAYLALGAFVCVFTGILALVGKAPSTVDNSLFSGVLYLAGGFNFVLAWRRWANGTGQLRAHRPISLHSSRSWRQALRSDRPRATPGWP